MEKHKLPKGVKIAIFVVLGLIAAALLTHLTVNYLVPFIAGLHNVRGVY